MDNENKIEWIEVHSGRTYTSPFEVRVYKEVLNGIPTGVWKEVHPAISASGYSCSIYHYPYNTDATSSY